MAPASPVHAMVMPTSLRLQQNPSPMHMLGGGGTARSLTLAGDALAVAAVRAVGLFLGLELLGLS